MSKLDELKLAFEHYRNVQNGNGSEFIKENGRNNRSPHCELIEAVYDVLYCDTEANAALTAAAEQLREKDEELKRLGERLAAAEYALDRADSAIEWYQQMTKTTVVGKGCEISGIGARDNIREYKNNCVAAANWLPQPEQQGGG